MKSHSRRYYGQSQKWVIACLFIILLIGGCTPMAQQPVISPEAVQMVQSRLDSAAFDNYMSTNLIGIRLANSGFPASFILDNANTAADVKLIEEAAQFMINNGQTDWIANVTGIIVTGNMPLIAENVPLDIMGPIESGFILIRRNYLAGDYRNAVVAIANRGTYYNNEANGITEPRELQSLAVHAGANAMELVGGFSPKEVGDQRWLADRTAHDTRISPTAPVVDPALLAAIFKPHNLAYQAMKTELGIDTSQSVYQSSEIIDPMDLEPDERPDFQTGFRIVFQHPIAGSTTLFVNPENNKVHYNGTTFDIILFIHSDTE